MNRKSQRPHRRGIIPGVDQLESRQMLSMAAMPMLAAESIHHRLPIHRSAEVGGSNANFITGTHPLVDAVHKGNSPMTVVSPPAVPATTTVPGFNLVASPTITRSSLSAVATIANNDMWAVGGTSPFAGGSTTLAEHFNGTSWTVVATPNPGPFGSTLTGVAAAATNNVWAVGSSFADNSFGEPDPSTLIEHFNGSAWSVVPSPTPAGGGVLSSVTVISPNDVWAVGHVGFGRGGNLIEHFNGTAWSIVASPQGTDAFLTSVSGTSANDVFAVGSIGRFDGISILHFNGTSWTAVAGLPDDSALEGVVAIAPNNVWAVGADIEHFNGTTWSVVPSPADFGLVSIAAASATNIYAVGGGIEHWDGTSWTNVSDAVPSNDEGPLFLGVTVLSTGTAIAVGSAQPLTGPNNFNQVIEQN